MYVKQHVSCRLVTLIKTGPTTTVIWDHSSRTAYKAAPCCSLGPGCSVGASFLGQVVMDREYRNNKHSNSNDTTIREEENDEEDDLLPEWSVSILIFDVQSIGTGSKDNFMLNSKPAQERYALLRHIGADHRSGIFTGQSIRVQWAGNLDALAKFHASEGAKLPHVIDCYVRLGRDSPAEGLALVVAPEASSSSSRRVS